METIEINKILRNIYTINNKPDPMAYFFTIVIILFVIIIIKNIYLIL